MDPSTGKGAPEGRARGRSRGQQQAPSADVPAASRQLAPHSRPVTDPSQVCVPTTAHARGEGTHDDTSYQSTSLVA